MTTYYVRKTGSDANAGTSAGAAWLTIGKALTTIASGDTCYVGAGIYREANVTVTITPTAETKILADVDGVQTGDAGEVTWTAYATNDKTAPAATTQCLSLNGKQFLTFERFYFVGGSRLGSNCVDSGGGTKNITFRYCVFQNSIANTAAMNPTATVNVAMNWTVDSCIFSAGVGLGISAPTSTTADYDLNFQVTNCLFSGISTDSVTLAPSGANAFKPGGVDVFNCSFVGKASGLKTVNASSTSIPCTIYNCFIHATGTGINANASGQITEDYNVIWATTARANVTAGVNSVAGDPNPYAPLMEVGQSIFQGRALRPPFVPMLTSPLLAFGNQAGGPAVDLLGFDRPSGSSPTWSSVLKAVGCYERGNTGIREVTTVRTGANALAINGPGCQDFELPVDVVATTITVYVRWDAGYTGTKPQMKMLNGTQAGVTNATATAIGAGSSWEQLSLTFTPTAQGIVTIRLQNNSTTANQNAYYDDFAVS